MIRPVIGLDFDDVFAPFNSIACEMANEEYGTTLSIEDITSWANDGEAAIIKKYYHDTALYTRQTRAISEKNKSAVRELMKFADVYFCSGVYPAFMSIRAQQIMEIFPELPADRIILGVAKNLVQFDFMLDDNINNVLSSPAKYPVLFRKPWNSDMTGLLSVNTLDEFVCLVKNVIYPMATDKDGIVKPSVIALVGPSGSGKNHVCDMLCSEEHNPFGSLFERPDGYTTKPDGSGNRTVLSEKHFAEMEFFEKTRYAGFAYGITRSSVEEILAQGKYPVVPIDICGAIGMKLHFPTIIVYLKRGKCELVADIIADTISDKEKMLRILSLDAEKKNENICDYSFKSENAVEEIKNLINH